VVVCTYGILFGKAAAIPFDTSSRHACLRAQTCYCQQAAMPQFYDYHFRVPVLFYATEVDLNFVWVFSEDYNTWLR
jgi:hypothetical protein